MYHTFGPTLKRRESPVEIGKVRAKMRCVRMGPVFRNPTEELLCARRAELWPLSNNVGGINSHALSVLASSRTHRDPLVDLVEYSAALVHRVADHPCLDANRVEVAEYDHVTRPAPKTFTHETPLGR